MKGTHLNPGQDKSLPTPLEGTALQALTVTALVSVSLQSDCHVALLCLPLCFMHIESRGRNSGVSSFRSKSRTVLVPVSTGGCVSVLWSRSCPSRPCVRHHPGKAESAGTLCRSVASLYLKLL